MKKIIGIIFLIIILMTTTVLAAYPEDLENSELETIKSGNFIELTDQQLKDAEKFIKEPANENYSNSNEVKEIQNSNNVAEDSDIYEINQEVSITKKVNGNVYAMGEKVNFDGALIQGNVFVFGKEVELKNTQIEGALYVIGENIEISCVANDVYACGANIIITENANIWRDIKIAGSVVEINGTVGRNAFLGVNELIVGENTVITGTLNYVSPNEAELSSNARIENVNFQKQEVEEVEEVVEFNPISCIITILTVLFKTFIISLLIICLSDKFNKLKRTEKVASELLKNAGIGALALILVPIASICLLFTGVASVMGIMAILIYILIVYASSSIASVEIATRILDKIKKEETISNGKKIGTSVLVALALYIVGLIPVVGSIVKFAFVLIGLGIIFDLVFKKV